MNDIVDVIAGLTNSEGRVVLKLTRGEYQYLLDHDAFNSESGVLTVVQHGNVYESGLTSTQTYPVEFNILNPTGDPSAGAHLFVRGKEYLSDNFGKVSLQIKNGYTKYKVTQTDIADKYGEVLVDGETIVVVNLVGAFYDVSVTVTDPLSRLVRGAVVTMNSVELTTDLSGNCVFQDVNIGVYKISVSKPNQYVNLVDSVSVVDQEISKTLNMHFSLSPYYITHHTMSVIESDMVSLVFSLSNESYSAPNSSLILPSGIINLSPSELVTFSQYSTSLLQNISSRVSTKVV